MKVKYWWTEDGAPEMCERAERILEEDMECYHCTARLPKKARVSVLTSLEDGDKYVVCTACADNNTQVL